MTRFTLGLPALFALLSCAATPTPPMARSSEPQGPREPVLARPVDASAPRLTRKEQVRRILPHNVRLTLLEGEKIRSTA